MDYELGKTVAKRFGITLVCLLAARGCTRELREWAQPLLTHTTTTTYQNATPDDITRTLQRERYVR